MTLISILYAAKMNLGLSGLRTCRRCASCEKRTRRMRSR